MIDHQGKVSRRCSLKLLAGGVAAAMIASPTTTRAQSNLVIATGGGPLTESFRKSMFRPWQEASGVRIEETANVYPKLKAMVEANATEWDVVQMDSTSVANFAKQGHFEPIDYGVIDRSKFIVGAPRNRIEPNAA